MAPLFNLRGCTYKVQKSKEAAARVVVWRMGIVRSYTMEASYCGASLGRYKVGRSGGGAEGRSRGCRGDTMEGVRYVASVQVGMNLYWHCKGLEDAS